MRGKDDAVRSRTGKKGALQQGEVRGPVAIQWWKSSDKGQSGRGRYPTSRNPCSDGYGNRPAAVGTFEANGFGLHDMLGNVWEWVADCSGEATEECAERTVRGGGYWTSPLGDARLARVLRWRDPTFGFRVARDCDASCPE